jgi:exosortase
MVVIQTSNVGTTSIATRTLLFVAFALVTALAQLDVLRALIAFSRGDTSASHLVLIPFVSFALVWQRRDVVFASVSTNWRGGLGVISCGLGVAVAARLIPLAEGQTKLGLLVGALLIVWIGAFLLLFGWRAFRAARFALAFLVFTIPIPPVLINGATELLKRGSAHAVAALFTLTGTPYHREEFVFTLPRLTIEVADACSGIRSSIALILTALLAGHMYLKSSWTKLLLIVAVLPVAVLKNGLRIVSLSLLAIHVDPSFLAGRLHTDGGIVFFLMGLALLLPVLAVLRRWESLSNEEHDDSAAYSVS